MTTQADTTRQIGAAAGGEAAAHARPALAGRFTAVAVLIASLALTLAAAYYSWRSVQLDERARLEKVTLERAGLIRSRLTAYFSTLVQTRAYLRVSPAATREDFGRFVAGINLAEYFPGVQGLGWAPRVLTEGGEGDGFPVTMLEPLDWHNQRVLGFDMMSEPRRAAAMRAARDSGRLRATAPLPLAAAAADAPTGILVYAPLYADGAALEDVEARRGALIGFVYAALGANDMFDAIFRTAGDDDSAVTFTVHDGEAGGEAADPTSLLYRRASGKPASPIAALAGRLEDARRLELAGRVWTLHAAALPGFRGGSAHALPLGVLLGGGCVSLLLFRLVSGHAASAAAERASLRREQGARQEAEEHRAALRRQTETMTTILDGTNAGLLLLDARGRVTYMNPAASRMTGWRLQDVGDRTLHELLLYKRPDGKPIPEAECRLSCAVQSEVELRDHEDWFVRRNGGLFPVLCSARPVLEAGRRVSTVLEMRDITAQKTAERELVEGRQTIERLNKIGLQLAAELDQEKLVQIVTDTCTELTGAQFGAFFHNVTDDRGDSYMLYSLSGAPREAFSFLPMPRNTAIFGPTFAGAGIVRLADVTRDPRYGREAPYHGMPKGHLPVKSYLAVPVKSRTGEVHGGLFFGHEDIGVFDERAETLAAGVASMAAIAIDNAQLFRKAQREIDRRRTAEAAVRRAADELEERVTERTAALEAANRELEAFSYSVSHDLRAPLRAIDGFSEAILRHYSDRLDARGTDYLQRVRAGSQRMGQLIDDMLALARVTRREMARDDVNLSNLALAVVEELRLREPDRRVEVSIAPGLVASGDPVLLRTALENLLHNAWKFSSLKPAAQIEFGAMDKDGRTVYFVRDDGAGFDMSYSSKLFGAFQRLHATNEFPGTGIGLATVQRIVRRHGGTIWVEAQVDRGATFYFTL